MEAEVAVVVATDRRVEVRWTAAAPALLDLICESAHWPNQVVTAGVREFVDRFRRTLRSEEFSASSAGSGNRPSLSVVEWLCWAAFGRGWLEERLWWAVRAAREGTPVEYDPATDTLRIWFTNEKVEDAVPVAAFFWEEVGTLYAPGEEGEEDGRPVGVVVWKAKTVAPSYPPVAELLALVEERRGTAQPQPALRGA